ncbi:MAG TPA: DUF3298 domain-containing protein [Humidesulfovibrio sp.]|uniref:DUF3298 and DUF4163 domain-containing protein n=1 Tax=Humidesulfovibrio sp. TaxID=2910988 RepID=UPI002C1DA426|nr:DUF3298 domain-containing protein [Humidesulfovibrio sp.]HWR03592.1 DUF3298 domain-containing protein [Humidesulfovibrio sp.]
MRIPVRSLAPAGLALTLLLTGCGLEQPTPPAAPQAEQAQSAPQTPAPAAMAEAEVLNGLNALVNDTIPASDEYEARRMALAPAQNSPALSDNLRRVLAQTLAFDPPRLRERWEKHQEAQADAAALYAANPPANTKALEGARVLRRLGPALYLVRLPGGDTVFFATSRKLKNNARLKGISSLERQRPKPDAAKGDLVDELADQPRTFSEISRQDAKALETRRAPALAELRRLEGQTGAFERGVAADLARLDALTRDVNAVISPELLPKASAPAPAALIRKVKRVAKSYSREQYYRYALPVTGQPAVDAALKTFLDERRAEMQDLLKSTGIGRGRARANVDRIAFTAHAASPALLSIRFEEMRDTGGAHPNTTYASFVFDLRSQSRLKFADIFADAPAALAVLSQLAERRMSLVLDGLVFPEGLAATPENFAVFVLDGADIVFTFPPYQVASYAQGTQTLRVPLCHPRLLPLLTPKIKAALAAK